MNFKSDYTPKVGDFGKFIIYRNKEGSIVLAASTEDVETARPKTTLRQVEKHDNLTGYYVGDPSQIAYFVEDGLSSILGWASFTVPKENRVNIFGVSLDYDGIKDDELVKKCLGDKVEVKRLH